MSCSGLREDRQLEASYKSTKLILRAYYGKDSHKILKIQASPRRYLQPKRPKAGYSRLPTDPVKLAVLDREVQQIALKVAKEPVPVGQDCFYSHVL